MGKEEFGIESNALILSFIGGFGAVKAILNLFAGNISDRGLERTSWYWVGSLVCCSFYFAVCPNLELGHIC
jgi:hypothetical protein